MTICNVLSLVTKLNFTYVFILLGIESFVLIYRTSTPSCWLHTSTQNGCHMRFRVVPLTALWYCTTEVNTAITTGETVTCGKRGKMADILERTTWNWGSKDRGLVFVFCDRVFKVVYSLPSDISQSAHSLLDWVITGLSVFDWVPYMYISSEITNRSEDSSNIDMSCM